MHRRVQFKGTGQANGPKCISTSETQMTKGPQQLLKRPAHGPSDKKRNGGLLSWFHCWRRRRKAVETMRNMPDYLLKDIGISRCQIDKASRGGHREDLTFNG